MNMILLLLEVVLEDLLSHQDYLKSLNGKFYLSKLVSDDFSLHFSFCWLNECLCIILLTTYQEIVQTNKQKTLNSRFHWESLLLNKNLNVMMRIFKNIFPVSSLCCLLFILLLHHVIQIVTKQHWRSCLDPK